MTRTRPGILAVRAVNQYRKRDVLTYLALRYYLNCEAARSDRWAQEVATDLVLGRSDLPYFHAHHFKDLSAGEKVAHRPMFLPCANEALAEAALLSECARHPMAFANPNCVFSYPLSAGDDRSGIFPHYSAGLANRHSAIADACDDFPSGVVRYLDIKRFYPSISPELALTAWKRQTEAAGLTSRWRDLGEKLIDDHSRVTTDSKASILTGPMFSHLIGNLVLRTIDDELSANLPARYFRYVDDITLVGTRPAIETSVKQIRDRLGELGLEIHEDWSPKSLELPTNEWLIGRHDFRQSRREISWMTLIGDLKRYLIVHPYDQQRLQNAFRDEGFRIPVRDYSSAIYEHSFLEKFARLATTNWFQKRMSNVSIGSIVAQARSLRNSLESEFREIIDDYRTSTPFEKKRRITKLRYRAGRMCYLSPEDKLMASAAAVSSIQELHFQAEVMTAIASGDIDRVINLGTNAAQAAAQPMRAGAKTATSSIPQPSDAQAQALAIFELNGVTVSAENRNQGIQSDLLRFSETGGDVQLMKSTNSFLREIACLHGISERPRHAEILESVFDEDEDLATDTTELVHQSISL